MMEIYLDEVPNDDFEKHFKLIESLASGSFGKVIRAIELKTNEEVAVKIIAVEEYSDKSYILKQEINILQQLNHKNIVSFLGYIEAKDKMYIVMKLLKGGTITDLLEKTTKSEKKLTELECSVIIKHLLEAVKYLHEQEVVHRDIKPCNVMFENPEDFTSLKLIDFGVSAQYVNDELLFDSCGTFIYMAPEQLGNKAYNKPIDMWSCGMIMYILLNNGKHPLYKKGMNRKQFMALMKNPKWEYKNKLSQMAISLLHKLLEMNPSRRYTVEKALKHPWITREKYGNIPETYFEAWRIASIKQKFKQAFGMTLFLMNYHKINNNTKKKTAKENKEKSFLSYALLVKSNSQEQKERLIKKRDQLFDPLYFSFENDERNEKINITNEKNNSRRQSINVNSILHKYPFKNSNNQLRRSSIFAIKDNLISNKDCPIVNKVVNTEPDVLNGRSFDTSKKLVTFFNFPTSNKTIELYSNKNRKDKIQIDDGILYLNNIANKNFKKKLKMNININKLEYLKERINYQTKINFNNFGYSNTENNDNYNADAERVSPSIRPGKNKKLSSIINFNKLSIIDRDLKAKEYSKDNSKECLNNNILQNFIEVNKVSSNKNSMGSNFNKKSITKSQSINVNKQITNKVAGVVLPFIKVPDSCKHSTNKNSKKW